MSGLYLKVNSGIMSCFHNRIQIDDHFDFLRVSRIYPVFSVEEKGFGQSSCGFFRLSPCLP